MTAFFQVTKECVAVNRASNELTVSIELNDKIRKSGRAYETC